LEHGKSSSDVDTEDNNDNFECGNDEAKDEDNDNSSSDGNEDASE